MQPLSIAIALLAGLTASAHCVVMCGSIICSFSPSTRRQLGFHVGRVLGYAVAGSLVAAVGTTVHRIAPSNTQWTLRALTAFIGVLVGLHTAGVLSIFSRFERYTKAMFARVSPKIAGIQRARGAAKTATAKSDIVSMLLGLLWSLVPCGMVYAALALAALSTSPIQGALTMLAFGLGTSPALLAFGWITRGATQPRIYKPLRVVMGLLVAGLSLWQGLSSLDNAGWFGTQYLSYWDHGSTCTQPIAR